MVQTKEEKAEKHRIYYQTENGKRNTYISIWKQRGLVCDSKEEYEEIYKRWLNSTSCEEKGCKYTKENFKCMDHEHIDGEI